MYMGYLVVQTSKELEAIKNLQLFLEKEDAHLEISETHISVKNDKNNHEFSLDKSIVGQHIRNIIKSKVSPDKLGQKLYIDLLGNKIYNRNTYAQHASNLIVFFGLFGTIVGIIMTFWPYMQAGNVGNMILKIQSELGAVFSGVGAAFYPSAFAAIACIFLIINDRILMLATSELIDKITILTENYIIPMVKHEHSKTQS
jgi:hypothetical protein